MPTKNPRVNVTFNPNDAEILQMICEKKKLSMSALVRKVIEDWLEEYEDMLLARRAEEVEKEWIKEGGKTISLEDLCKELDIELNLEEEPKKILKNSQKTSKKGSSGRSTRGLKSHQKKSVNL